MDETSLVIFREYKQEDEACIYATWRNNWYYSAAEKKEGNPKKLFKEQNQRIKEILKIAKVKIACLDTDPNTIIGYSVSTNTHLDWIYVKSDYRNKGIGALLKPKNITSFTNDLTKIGKAILEKKNLLKGESNGRNTGIESSQSQVETFKTGSVHPS